MSEMTKETIETTITYDLLSLIQLKEFNTLIEKLRSFNVKFSVLIFNGKYGKSFGFVNSTSKISNVYCRDFYGGTREEKANMLKDYTEWTIRVEYESNDLSLWQEIYDSLDEVREATIPSII